MTSSIAIQVLPKVDSEEELMVKAREFLNSTMDFYGRLINCIIFQTPTTSGVMICAHHIVVDGFSGFVMSKQIRGINILNPVKVDGEYYEKDFFHLFVLNLSAKIHLFSNICIIFAKVICFYI